MADLVAGELEQLGIEVTMDVDIPGQEGDIQNGKQSNGETPPEGEVKKAGSSRPTSSSSRKDNGSDKKPVAEINNEKQVADAASSKKGSSKPSATQNGVDNKQQEGSLQGSLKDVPETDSNNKVAKESTASSGIGHQQEGSVVDKKEQKSSKEKQKDTIRVYSNGDDDDAESEFESLISAILENDDGNEADVETLTELQSIYAHSRLSGCPTRPEMYRSLAQAMVERLVQSALLAGSRDNITAMVILLPGCKL